jgi:hypothetical protein
MKPYYIALIAIISLLAGSAHAKGKTHYSANVKSMDQELIPSPARKDKKKVYEGCGPIAVAMLLGYWQTERGFKRLLAKGFDGTKHPSNAIVKLYKELKTKKAPGKKELMSYTMPDNLYRGLKDRVKGVKLKADRMKKIKGWSKREEALKAQLKKGNPVILLKNKEHKDGCLGSSSKGWNPIKNISTSHYFLAVGFKGGKVAVMPGLQELNKSLSSSFGVHKKVSSSHALCTWDELKKAKVSLFWIEKD